MIRGSRSRSFNPNDTKPGNGDERNFGAIIGSSTGEEKQVCISESSSQDRRKGERRTTMICGENLVAGDHLVPSNCALLVLWIVGKGCCWVNALCRFNSQADISTGIVETVMLSRTIADFRYGGGTCPASP